MSLPEPPSSSVTASVSASEPLPAQLALASFVAQGQSWEGAWPQAQIEGCPEPFARLRADSSGPDGLKWVRWRWRGELRQRPAAAPEPWLHLQAAACLVLQCQRCLEPAELIVEGERWFRFVATEEQAAAEDESAEEDVLALQDPLDWVTLLEDELILSLPLVPLHEVCPQPLPTGQDAGAESLPEREHPFAALEALLRPGEPPGVR